MSANGIEQLREVKDFRVKDGQRHQLWLVLLFVIMGTMSGYVGYRPSHQPKDLPLMILTNSSLLWNETALRSWGAVP
ncbi:hypothetical protein DP117_02605 [Brasilonema sp. UFV-L1]|nr:hypothetical protein [Brasilonema sp. UFV-L1]